ncbi:MAG: hypothetical protein AAGE92_07785 [Cyanobacteria bacterium P01_G01_bin.4]
MDITAAPIFQAILDEILQSGLHKGERLLATPQGAEIAVMGGQKAIN